MKKKCKKKAKEQKKSNLNVFSSRLPLWKGRSIFFWHRLFFRIGSISQIVQNDECRGKSGKHFILYLFSFLALNLVF